MKLVRIGDLGRESAGVLVSEDAYVDVSDLVGDFDSRFFESGAIGTLSEVAEKRVSEGRVEAIGGKRIGAPIARPQQILCIGLNYSDHAAESGMPVPDEPILFTKSPNTLVGPNDDVQIPRRSVKTDWEIELGVVLGRRCSYLADEAEAHAAIAGYLIVNDLSEREWQLERGGQWTKGKSAPTFNPAGPYLVTADEVGDALSLDMTLDIDGVRRQTGNTSTMVFTPAFLIHYLSQFLTLEPGDLINTGTPPGVGLGMKPPTYLRGGEVMTLSISKLGTAVQRVLADETAG